MICFSPPVFSHVLFQCRGPSQRKLIYAKIFMMGRLMLDCLFDSKWNNKILYIIQYKRFKSFLSIQTLGARYTFVLYTDTGPSYVYMYVS